MLKVDAVIVMRFGVGLTDDERSIVLSNKDEERQEVRGAFQICTKIIWRVRSKGRGGQDLALREREKTIKLTNQNEGWEI